MEQELNRIEIVYNTVAEEWTKILPTNMIINLRTSRCYVGLHRILAIERAYVFAKKQYTNR
jgi:hypothetical protein